MQRALQKKFLHPKFTTRRFRLAAEFIIYAMVFSMCFPRWAIGSFLTGAGQLSMEGAAFSWEEARSKSLQILIEYRDGTQLREASVGSGSLISQDGLFVTAYHVMKYCLLDEKEVSRFSDKIDCSTEEHPILRYKARNGDREFGIEIISHLRERDSTEGKDSQTPDEILKHRDFVIGKLKAEPNERFSQWNVKEFKEGTINLAHPDADFELKPLLPPKKVFIAGYPKDRGFVISHGFLNLTEHNNRGYFAAAIDVYAPAYLESQEISTDTRWGIRVENQMSGGPVVDSSGHLVGIVVNSADDNTAVLSIENVVETFFSSSATGTYPFFISIPTQRPLHLKGNGRNADTWNLS